MYTQVNDFSADAIVSQLLLLDSADPTKVQPAHRLKKLQRAILLAGLSQTHSALMHPANRSYCLQDIKLFINSPGGSVTAGMGIYDAMQVSSHA